MKYKLFTTPWCKACPSVKAYVAGLDLDVEMIDASTVEGKEEAMKYGIRSVPTMLFFADENMEKPVATAQSIQQIEETMQ